MKLYFAASKTPILDLTAIGFVIAVYLGGFGELLARWVFGDLADKAVENSEMVLFICQLLAILIIFMVSIAAALILFRFVARRFFGVKTGEGYVEWDVKKNEAKTVIKDDNDS